MIGDAISKAVEGDDLDANLMHGAMEDILSGNATNAQIAALLVALRIKGETSAELAAAAQVMRRHCTEVRLGTNGVILDTCGTGGDGLGTFNISTIAAIVVSASGVVIAKHGNRAASSKAGSADLLEALGIDIEMPPQRVARCIDEIGIGFMFASTYHPAMQYAAPVRSELGIRTLFNLLGPLTNPAGATHQLLGVYDGSRIGQIAEVLSILGSKRVWVVHGHGGVDEVSCTGPTQIVQLGEGDISRFELNPEDFGLTALPLDSLTGGDTEENAAIARKILAGEKGPKRDAVLINAAAALCVAGVADSPKDGVAKASSALDSGAAETRLQQWVEFSQRR